MAETEIERTWLKVERESRKTGLRDGISAGRDSNFQSSFDEGFKQGFKNGFLLGTYKGAVKLLPKESIASDDVTHLEKTTRGSCVLCESDNLENEDLEEVKVRQDSRISELSKILDRQMDP